MQPLRSECVQKEMLFPIWKYKAVNENMRKKSFSGISINTMPVKADKPLFVYKTIKNSAFLKQSSRMGLS